MNKVEAAREWICSHNDGDVLYVKDAFVGGADWAIDKAVKWLEDNYPYYFEHASIKSELTFGEEFRKAMED